jgi:hypothetical protein
LKGERVVFALAKAAGGKERIMRDYYRENLIALKLCFFLLIFYLAVCVSAVSACSPTHVYSSDSRSADRQEDFEALYQKALELYNAGNYEKSIEISKSIIESFDREGKTNLPAESPYELAFLLIADCQVRVGNQDAAQAAISDLVSAIEKGIVPSDTLAKAELKSANIYLEFQNYDASLSRFQQVILDFPDSPFSHYAAEKIEEIEATQTGEIRGIVKMRSIGSVEGITVTAFNGFGSASATTDATGAYTLPVYRSTTGTFLVLVATEEDYAPQVETVTMSEIGRCVAEDIELAPLEDINSGVLVGVCYKTIQGGKLRPVYGISSFVPGVDVVLTNGENRLSTKSNDWGLFIIALRPGTYTLLEPSGHENQEIKVKAGHTSVFHIGFPGITID